MKMILFDFDGVIVDTAADCLKIMNNINDFEINKKEFQDFLNGNVFEHDYVKDRVVDDTLPIDDPFVLQYIPVLMKTDPVPGMTELIKKLGKEFKLVVVSSTITSPIEEYLRTHDIFDLFDKVYGADVHASKHVKINMVFEEYGVSADDCLFITDTLGDMKEANMAQVKSIGVTWGFQDRAHLKNGNPIGIVNTVEELESLITNWSQDYA